MAQSEEISTQIVNKMLKIDGNGWNILLFQDVNKIINYLCTHCGGICCDAIELGCNHGEEDQILLYCKTCLSELVLDNGNKCMISGHYDPPLVAAQSNRRQILKAPVICPYSLVFKKRNNLKKNKNNNAQIIDTLGCDQKEGLPQIVNAPEAPQNDEKCSEICEWKGILSELKDKHITECVKQNDPTFVLNIKIKKLENENILLKEQIININTTKQNQINILNNQIVELNAKIHSQSLIIKDSLQSNDENNKLIQLLKEEKKQNDANCITNLNKINIFKGNKFCVIDWNNSIFTTKGSNDKCTETYCIIEREWSKHTNNGIHEIKLKCVQSASNAICIGMVTNNKIQTNKWLFDSTECGISYQLYMGYDTYICHYKHGNKQSKQSIPKRKSISDKWINKHYGPNETMGIKIDLNKCELMFCVNDKQIGQIIQIESNIYYPAIAYQVYNGVGILKLKLLNLY